MVRSLTTRSTRTGMACAVAKAIVMTAAALFIPGPPKCATTWTMTVMGWSMRTERATEAAPLIPPSPSTATPTSCLTASPA
eukprot:2790100-Rhodomonas_salina.2